MQMPLRAFIVHLFVAGLLFGTRPNSFDDPSATKNLLSVGMIMAESAALTVFAFILWNRWQHSWTGLQPGHMLAMFFACPVVMGLLSEVVGIAQLQLGVIGVALISAASIFFRKFELGWKAVILLYGYSMATVFGFEFFANLSFGAATVIVLMQILLSSGSIILDLRGGTRRDWMHSVGVYCCVVWWILLSCKVCVYRWQS